MKTSQISLFDEEKKYAKLTELGDPLEKLDSIMDWEMFMEKLTKACQKEEYEGRTLAHRRYNKVQGIYSAPDI